VTWWAGLPAVEVDGPEGADGHRLRWEDGVLSLVAHPDPEADRTLGALGGERCPCLDVADAWEAAHDDGAVLTVASRGADDPVVAAGAVVASLQADLRRWRSTSGSLVEEARLSQDTHAIDRLVAVAGPAEKVAARRLGFLLLVGLDARLLHRLQASVAAALATRPDRAAPLAAATAARALPRLRDLGWAGGLADVAVTADGGPELAPDRALLPPTWVAEVWGRDLAAAVDGHLVVEVTAVTDEGLDVVALAPAGKARMAVRVAPVGE
jgi:hypothetical protein